MSISGNIRAGAAYVEVTAQTSKLQRGLASAQAQLQQFGRSCTSIGKDMLMLTTCTLTLTDEDFMSFLSEINRLALKYMDIEVRKDSKTRQVTLISAPSDGQVT